MKNRRKIMLITAAAVTVLFAIIFSVYVLSEEKKDESEKLPVTILGSGSDYSDVSVEITDISLDGIRPFVKIKWKNSGNIDCVFGSEYDIRIKKEDGSFISTLNNDIWTSIAYILEGGKETTKIYYIDDKTVPEGGTYRFVSHFNTEANGVRSDDYAVYIEFSAERGVSGRGDRLFGIHKVIYDNGNSQEAVKAENLPHIRLSPSMVLWVVEDGKWIEKGQFQEITLNKDNFDKRIWHSGVTDQISAVDVRTSNKRAWQLQVNRGIDTDSSTLYVLLEQDNGLLIFGEGVYNDFSLPEPNSDYSYIKYLGLLIYE